MLESCKATAVGLGKLHTLSFGSISARKQHLAELCRCFSSRTYLLKGPSIAHCQRVQLKIRIALHFGQDFCLSGLTSKDVPTALWRSGSILMTDHDNFPHFFTLKASLFACCALLLLQIAQLMLLIEVLKRL